MRQDREQDARSSPSPRGGPCEDDADEVNAIDSVMNERTWLDHAPTPS
jgi:hypothetical protein